MSHYKKDFVGTHKKGWHIINIFEGPKVHTMYEGTIAWKIHDDSVHPHQVEIPNDLYVPKGRKRLISPQHWSHNSTSANTDATTLYVTQCVTHHDYATLIWGGGQFIFTVPIGNQIIFHLHTAPGYTFSLHIVLLLVMNHINMMIPLNVSLTNFAVPSCPSVTHNTTPSTMHPYLNPE